MKKLRTRIKNTYLGSLINSFFVIYLPYYFMDFFLKIKNKFWTKPEINDEAFIDFIREKL